MIYFNDYFIRNWKCGKSGNFVQKLRREEKSILRAFARTRAKNCPIYSTHDLNGHETKKMVFEFLNLGFGGLQKYDFFKSTNYQYIFTKISGFGNELFCEYHSFFFVHYGGLYLSYFTLVGSWIRWFISIRENNNFYVKLSKFTKWQLFSLKMTTLFI